MRGTVPRNFSWLPDCFIRSKRSIMASISPQHSDLTEPGASSGG
uniref:PYM homolog 1, exon junction complex associated factor n=1 Tax=Saimiri boliviensis boliviensis TaxID=39432 RepID=A0A2K6U1V1_SAIBB